jgi:hypothetical protein
MTDETTTGWDFILFEINRKSWRKEGDIEENILGRRKSEILWEFVCIFVGCVSERKEGGTIMKKKE